MICGAKVYRLPYRIFLGPRIFRTAFSKQIDERDVTHADNLTFFGPYFWMCSFTPS